MKVRMEANIYSEYWEEESTLFNNTGIYKRLSEITPSGNVLEIGSGAGFATLTLASSRKMLALDNNEHLAEKARLRLAAAEVAAEIVVADVFEPSAQCVKAVEEFGPKVIVGWFLGSSADVQFKYVPSDVPHHAMGKVYRENMEVAMLCESLCPPSVEWVHLALRTAIPVSVSEGEIERGQKLDYDQYLFQSVGFEVVDVQVLDWDNTDSNFQYSVVRNSNVADGEAAFKVISVLAKRTTSKA